MTRVTSTKAVNNTPAGTLMDMQYTYNNGQNNGRIAEAKDFVNGEDVTYAYDSLQRLTAASTADPDGFETTGNGMSGWTVDAGTWTTSSTAAHSGTAGAIATAAGSQIHRVLPASAGNVWTSSAWATRASGSGHVILGVQFHDGGGNLLSQDSGTYALSAAWQQYSKTFMTAPGTSGTANSGT